MKLGVALSKLKSEKGKLARLINLRKKNAYLEAGMKSAYSFNELSDEINERIKEIRKLKIQIQKTNVETMLDGKITLAETIIKIGDLRSQIAKLSDIPERESFLSRWDRDKKNYVPTFDEKGLERELERLESEKVLLDNELQKRLWEVDLIQ